MDLNASGSSPWSLARTDSMTERGRIVTSCNKMKDRRIATVNCVLPLAFWTIQFYPFKPGNVPMRVITIRSPRYGMLRPLFSSTMSVLARVVNIVQYIPVADATAGCISN